MSLGIAFRDVCRFVKEDDPKLIEQADNLLGLVIVLTASATPLSLAETALGLLGTKNELTKLGQRIFTAITAKRDTTTLAYHRRMEAAYGLICYTAFFEAVDVLMPEAKKLLSLTPKEKLHLSVGASSRATAVPEDRQSSDSEACEHFVAVPFPHPTEKLDQHNERLGPLYKELAAGLSTFIEKLAVWEQADEETHVRLRGMLEAVPAKALDLYRGQYFRLASKYQEFFVWASLNEHKEAKYLLNQLSNRIRGQVRLTEESKTKIDIGFARLEALITDVSSATKRGEVDRVLAELGSLYRTEVEQPVIDDQYDPDVGEAALTYPRRCDAFVPQSFRVVRYTGKQRLEDPATWLRVEERNDLGAFLLSYLSSPHSARSPLIVLGHPGSGKSLLTRIIAARLISQECTPIRVELRSIDADNEIAAQIEEQIEKDVNRTLAWADIAENTKENAAVVILDGYDELLQASGEVFAGYPTKVKLFQEREISLGRSEVRAIITSRITLIDKARIPVDATILRLEEFDAAKRDRWASVWNNANRQYFLDTGVEPFRAPDSDPQLVQLAKQPLLLLMLAVYDSEENQLRKASTLDQTELYDNLLRRFIRRERWKGEGYINLTDVEQEEAIEYDMERLGVAAIGMFNRRALHIHTGDLNADLRLFEVEREMPKRTGRALSQADLLLGSFFFVHESKSAKPTDNSSEHEADAAFEFLHNTFGEFLTADFVLRRVLVEAEEIQALRTGSSLRAALQRRLEGVDGPQHAWYASLIYTPLSSRPVVLQMIREWLPHRLSQVQRSKIEFEKNLDSIILPQLKRLLASHQPPVPLIEVGLSTFPYLSFWGRIAIYSLNLVLLRVVLASEGFTFTQGDLEPQEQEIAAWNRLTQLWRSWFSLDTLNELAAVIYATPTHTGVHVRARMHFVTPPGGDRLDLITNVSVALANSMEAALAGFASFSGDRSTSLSPDETVRHFRAEEVDFEVEVALVTLNKLGTGRSNYHLREAVLHKLDLLRRSHIGYDALLDLLRISQDGKHGHWRAYIAELLYESLYHGSAWFSPARRLECFASIIPYMDSDALKRMDRHVPLPEEWVAVAQDRPEIAINVLRSLISTGEPGWAKRLFKQAVREFLTLASSRRAPASVVVGALQVACELQLPSPRDELWQITIELVLSHDSSQFLAADDLLWLVDSLPADVPQPIRREFISEVFRRFFTANHSISTVGDIDIEKFVRTASAAVARRDLDPSDLFQIVKSFSAGMYRPFSGASLFQLMLASFRAMADTEAGKSAESFARMLTEEIAYIGGRVPPGAAAHALYFARTAKDDRLLRRLYMHVLRPRSLTTWTPDVIVELTAAALEIRDERFIRRLVRREDSRIRSTRAASIRADNPLPALEEFPASALHKMRSLAQSYGHRQLELRLYEVLSGAQ